MSSYQWQGDVLRSGGVDYAAGLSWIGDYHAESGVLAEERLVLYGLRWKEQMETTGDIGPPWNYRANSVTRYTYEDVAAWQAGEAGSGVRGIPFCSDGFRFKQLREEYRREWTQREEDSDGVSESSYEYNRVTITENQYIDGSWRLVIVSDVTNETGSDTTRPLGELAVLQDDMAARITERVNEYEYVLRPGSTRETRISGESEVYQEEIKSRPYVYADWQVDDEWVTINSSGNYASVSSSGWMPLDVPGRLNYNSTYNKARGVIAGVTELRRTATGVAGIEVIGNVDPIFTLKRTVADYSYDNPYGQIDRDLESVDPVTTYGDVIEFPFHGRWGQYASVSDAIAGEPWVLLDESLYLEGPRANTEHVSIAVRALNLSVSEYRVIVRVRSYGIDDSEIDQRVHVTVGSYESKDSARVALPKEYWGMEAEVESVHVMTDDGWQVSSSYECELKIMYQLADVQRVGYGAAGGDSYAVERTESAVVRTVEWQDCSNGVQVSDSGTIEVYNSVHTEEIRAYTRWGYATASLEDATSYSVSTSGSLGSWSGTVNAAILQLGRQNDYSAVKYQATESLEEYEVGDAWELTPEPNQQVSLDYERVGYEWRFGFA